ncbi:ATP-binding protein [Tardiphaga sp.]|uniref:GAF domain-containing sensor histidine kinase n=1 Tax=Tardiphaga sp. TaxID=1926292 RepID=UPI0037DA00E6
MTVLPPAFETDIAAVQQIEAVPKILEVVCRTTGMRFAAVARVTDSRWICCAVRDEIAFGLAPGGELKVETTLCHEIRQHREPVVIDHVAKDTVYCNHHTPALYGLQSYISMPIFLADGSFFGTLCAIDPAPHVLNTPETLGMFKLFAELIAFHLNAADKLAVSEADLTNERKTAELREQFIAVLGHDLRNPLASIAAVARRFRKAALSEEEFGYLDLMQNSVRRMAGLIDNVLDFARGRLGDGLTLTRTAQDLAPVLQQVVGELQAHAPGRQIDLVLDLKRPVDCDPARIGQLLSNLLGNALAYGVPARPITVSAQTGLQQFELSVTNHGAPIPPEILGKLFQPFSRGAGQDKQEGLGLGLYIASQIARAHGGMLSATSTVDETRFVLRMPLG